MDVKQHFTWFCSNLFGSRKKAASFIPTIKTFFFFAVYFYSAILLLSKIIDKGFTSAVPCGSQNTMC